jgi:alkanesulfonate monooxygenase SsuD/methylene tetrahydromethanopterin reductase-like flavin-dependent oxidoreductase (luciferase family)
MKFGIAFANVGPFAEPAAAADLAVAAETAGFESMWTVDHVVVPAGRVRSKPNGIHRPWR